MKRIALLVLVSVLLSGCGYNTLQKRDERVKAAWADVINEYQKRSDLLPNLVETVKAYAGHEKGTFQAVTEARARAGSIQATPELLNDPEALKRFEAAQKDMSSALSRLLVTVERYPDLKANANFMDLQRQLSTIERDIAKKRKVFIDETRDFNVNVRTFPNNLTAMLFGIKEKPQFTVENEKDIRRAPKVEFGK